MIVLFLIRNVLISFFNIIDFHKHQELNQKKRKKWRRLQCKNKTENTMKSINIRKLISYSTQRSDLVWVLSAVLTSSLDSTQGWLKKKKMQGVKTIEIMKNNNECKYIFKK